MNHIHDTSRPIPWWAAVLFTAIAGGMGWGIRGQYGHETGAMIAGVLVSLTLVYLLCRHLDVITGVRAAALATVAMGIGGTETYGVTLGLTHNPEMVGNWGALGWGLLGCLIKGSLWIGFAGLFLGIGLGGKRYRPLELLALCIAMLVAWRLGAWLLNSPFDIEGRRLPAIHFSNFWHWFPESEVRPRREAWGGQLFAVALALAYCTWWKKDALARNMGLWGVLGGAVGFPLGQSFQAFHAWNRDLFKGGIWTNLDPHINWWNLMEATFGFTMGAALGLGLWLNRRRIADAPDRDQAGMPTPLELVMLSIHVYLLVHVQFIGGWVAGIYDTGLFLAILPFVCNIRGRIWPWFMVTAVTLAPIASKTFKELVWQVEAIPLAPGFTVYIAIPLFAATVLAAAYAFESGATRRLFDLLVSALLIVLLLPMMFWFALAIRLSSAGPVLYQQERVGCHGLRFRLLKFRTMVAGAEHMEVPLASVDEYDDPRYTRVGRFLQRYALDDLPQLFNVLRGDLTLIGPPPLRPEEAESDDPNIQVLLEVRPGVAGFWDRPNGAGLPMGSWLAGDRSNVGPAPDDAGQHESDNDSVDYFEYVIGDKREFFALAVLLNVWVYFWLNFAFFRFPWPWADWTGRTPSGIVFTIFALGLTAMVFLCRDWSRPLPPVAEQESTV